MGVGSGWMGVGDGWWGVVRGCPHTRAHACTHTHAHACAYDIIGNSQGFPKNPMEAAICMKLSCLPHACVRVYVCVQVHVHVCAHV